MKCDLCKRAEARMYCDSDEARLCCECDERIHTVNFIVEKHTRVLLCFCCHSHTSWAASGGRLGHSVAFCCSCAPSDVVAVRNPESVIQDREEYTYDEEEEDRYEDGCSSSDESEEEDGHNYQIVPSFPAARSLSLHDSGKRPDSSTRRRPHGEWLNNKRRCLPTRD